MSIAKDSPTPEPGGAQEAASPGITAPDAELPSRAEIAAMDPQSQLAFANRKRLDREAARVERQQEKEG